MSFRRPRRNAPRAASSASGIIPNDNSGPSGPSGPSGTDEPDSFVDANAETSLGIPPSVPELTSNRTHVTSESFDEDANINDNTSSVENNHDTERAPHHHDSISDVPVNSSTLVRDEVSVSRSTVSGGPSDARSNSAPLSLAASNDGGPSTWTTTASDRDANSLNVPLTQASVPPPPSAPPPSSVSHRSSGRAVTRSSPTQPQPSHGILPPSSSTTAALDAPNAPVQAVTMPQTQANPPSRGSGSVPDAAVNLEVPELNMGAGVGGANEHALEQRLAQQQSDLLPSDEDHDDVARQYAHQMTDGPMRDARGSLSQQNRQLPGSHSSRRVQLPPQHVAPASIAQLDDNTSWRSLSESVYSNMPQHSSDLLLKLRNDIHYPLEFSLPHTMTQSSVKDLSKVISRRFARRVPSSAKAPDLNTLVSGKGADEERKRLGGSVRMATIMSRIYAIALPALQAHSIFELAQAGDSSPHLHPASGEHLASDDMASVRSVSTDRSGRRRMDDTLPSSSSAVTRLPYQAQLWIALYNVSMLALDAINISNMEVLAASNNVRSKQHKTQSLQDMQAAFNDGQTGFLAGTNIRVVDSDRMEDRLLRRLKLQQAIRTDQLAQSRSPGNKSSSNRPNRNSRNRSANSSGNRPSGSNSSTKDTAQGRKNE